MVDWIKQNLTEIEVAIVIVSSIIGNIGAWHYIVKEIREMKGTKWSTEEIELLYMDKSNQEVADLTGRTLEAVKRKRSYMTGHTVPEHERLRAIKENINKESRIKKECRIIAIAKRIGVKLRGK